MILVIYVNIAKMGSVNSSTIVDQNDEMKIAKEKLVANWQLMTFFFHT